MGLGLVDPSLSLDSNYKGHRPSKGLSQGRGYGTVTFRWSEITSSFIINPSLPVHLLL